MKIIPALILLISSTILFFTGMSVPGLRSFWHVALVAAGTVLGFIFYLITFIHVLKTPTLTSGKRIFWIVAIVCVPMIGNLIYILLQFAFTKKQTPKSENW